MTASVRCRVRCAIYSRKSSEEGLEQSFNSLQAQREACEAYIASQRHEGWHAVPKKYDDGGFSGGNMNRPGLKQLLDDTAARLVDTIVVYKVDRLTRSLTDFAKIIEVAKFIPGINSMAPPLAGSMKMRFMQFLGLDFLAAISYALAYGSVGFIFRDFLATIGRGFRAAAHAVEIVVVFAAIAFTAYRVSLYWKHRVYRIVPRIQVAELAAKLQTQYLGRILLADVRSHGYYDPDAYRIRGSIRLEPNNLSEEVKALPKDKDIYLYCT